MSKELIKRIAELDDYNIINFFKKFFDELFENFKVTSGDLIGNIPEEIKEIEELKKIIDLEENEKREIIDSKELAEFSRTILTTLSEDDLFAPLIETSLNEYKDENLMVGTIIAIGFAASLILLVATTKAEGKVGGISFKKDKASPELVQAVLDPFKKFLK